MINLRYSIWIVTVSRSCQIWILPVSGHLDMNVKMWLLRELLFALCARKIFAASVTRCVLFHWGQTLVHFPAIWFRTFVKFSRFWFVWAVDIFVRIVFGVDGFCAEFVIFIAHFVDFGIFFLLRVRFFDIFWCCRLVRPAKLKSFNLIFRIFHGKYFFVQFGYNYWTHK